MHMIGIDQGTTGTTIVAVNKNLDILSLWQRNHDQHRPAPGLLEHDAEEILQAVVDGLGRVLRELGSDARRVVSAGLANQGETVCAWDTATGKAIGNAIVWSDSRGTEEIESLSDEQTERLRSIAGLQADSYFSAAKIKWMMSHMPEVSQAMNDGKLGIGTLDTWLIWKLSHGKSYVTDASTASRTMLYDINNGAWSEEARSIMGLPNLPLAAVGSSCGPMATLSHPDWPVKSAELYASLVDQPAALFASGCWRPGEAKATYGTGCFLLIASGRCIPPKRRGLTASVAWDLGDGPAYMMDGAVYAAGSIIEWFERDCGWIRNAREIDDMLRASRQSDALVFVPTFDGLSAPRWDRNVRGFLSGITLSTGPAEIIRAALDGIAHQVADLVDCMRQTFSLNELRVDGGLTECEYLMQRQADLLGVPVRVCANPEMTALGAAAMAGLGAGLWTADELAEKLRNLPSRLYHPKIEKQTREVERRRWQRAVGLAVEASKLSR